MTLHKFLLSLFVAASLVNLTLPARGQDLGCSDNVSLSGGTIEVESDTSGDDTNNIQCALNAAADLGYRDILLISGEYSSGPISASGFVGDFRGVSKSRTSLAIQDASLDCENTVGVGMEFNTGSASVRNMTITVDSPCAAGSSASVIAFYSDRAKCSSRTTFGNVDRVVITGGGADSPNAVTGVLMQAAPGCEDASERILGTLKVNRSELLGLDFGVLTSVAGGGQVDINYNTFTEIGLPITILDASQSTTILSNTINYNDVGGYRANTGMGTTGILIASTSNSPDSNGTIIKNNKFFDRGLSDSGFGILLGQTSKRVDHKLIVTANTFEGNRVNTAGAGIAAIDTGDGILAGNRFKSNAGTWVEISNGNTADGYLGEAVTGWAVIANIFTASSANTDIVLGAGTSGTIIGRDQGLPVVDDQTGRNDVLESANATAYWGLVGAERFLINLANILEG